MTHRENYRFSGVENIREKLKINAGESIPKGLQQARQGICVI